MTANTRLYTTDMKNLMPFIHPSKDFLEEQKTSIKIQIDNSLDLGWRREDIILATNFPYQYKGVKSLLVSDDNYWAFCPTASCTNVIVELFERKLIEKEEIYWFHDLDAYQLHEITESELNLGECDIGLVEWDNGQKISGSSFFFKSAARDIFGWIKEVMYKYRVDEELAMSALYTNNLLWLTGSHWDALAKFVPLTFPDAENVQESVKKSNITYDFEMGWLNQHYPLSSKPIKTAHFHFTRDRLLDSAMYGKNSLNLVLLPERLIKIFHQHGVKGVFPKPMKNLMIYISPEKKFPNESEDLVKKQINNSLKLGWKEEDILLITNFPYEYKKVKSMVLDDKTNKSDVIFHLLTQGIVKEAELWWFHDLDVFQLRPIDSSQIDLKDTTTAGFTDNSAGKLDFGSIFFRKDSEKIFEWTRNRARKFRGDESAALDSLVKENYHHINSKYIKLNLKPGLIARPEPNRKYNCKDYSAFNNLQPGQTVLKVPCRSPLTVVEKIKPYIENKVVCELGSAVGDIALEMAKYARRVIGIEINEERVAISRKRGIETICADASRLPSLHLPEKADVYYMWMNPKPTRRIFDAIKSGVVIMAGGLDYWEEDGRGAEVKVLDEIHAENPGSQMMEFEYNEGDGDHESGILVLLIVEK